MKNRGDIVNLLTEIKNETIRSKIFGLFFEAMEGLEEDSIATNCVGYVSLQQSAGLLDVDDVSYVVQALLIAFPERADQFESTVKSIMCERIFVNGWFYEGVLLGIIRAGIFFHKCSIDAPARTTFPQLLARFLIECLLHKKLYELSIPTGGKLANLSKAFVAIDPRAFFSALKDSYLSSSPYPMDHVGSSQVIGEMAYKAFGQLTVDQKIKSLDAVLSG